MSQGVRRSGRSWSRLDGVDLLRGLAILFVLLNHVNMRLQIARIPYTHGLPEQLVSSLAWNGQRGVQMFFAISGFLITSTSIRRWGSLARVRARDFYLLRFARIAPLFLSLLFLLSLLHVLHIPNFVVSSKTGGLGRALLAALTFHVNVLEAHRGYLPGNWDILWSLSVEEMFYLFFPLVCIGLGRSKWFVPLLCIFVALGPFSRTIWSRGNEVWQEYSYLGAMDAIALGCLTALWASSVRFPRAALVWLFTCGAALLVMTLCFTNWVQAIGLRALGLDMSLLALGTSMLVAAFAQTSWRSWYFLEPIRLLGQRSYEVYLTHMFVVFAFFNVFLSTGRKLVFVPLLFIAVICVSGVVGELVARFYSEPMNRWLRERFGSDAKRLGSVIEHPEDRHSLDAVAPA